MGAMAWLTAQERHVQKINMSTGGLNRLMGVALKNEIL